MTIPTQRDAAGPDTGGWRLLEAINRVDDSVRTLTNDMASRFDRLDERFMPRREITARLEDSMRDRAELRSQIEQARLKHEADIERLDKAIDTAEEKREAEQEAREREAREQARERRNTRFALAGLGFTAIATGSGVLFGVATHFH